MRATGPPGRRVTRCPVSGSPALMMWSPGLTLPEAFTVRSASITSPDAGGSGGGSGGASSRGGQAGQVAGIEPGRQGLDAVPAGQDADLAEPGPEPDGPAGHRGPGQTCRPVIQRLPGEGTSRPGSTARCRGRCGSGLRRSGSARSYPGHSHRHRVGPRTGTASRYGRVAPGTGGDMGHGSLRAQDGIAVTITAVPHQLLLPAVFRYGRGRRPRSRRHRRNHRQPVRSAPAGSSCKRPGGGSPAGPPPPGSASSILTTSTRPPRIATVQLNTRAKPRVWGHPPPSPRRYRRRFGYTL